MGQRIQGFELWKTNLRNRIYRLRLADGRAAVAKQLVIGTAARLQHGFDQLNALGQLQIPGLHVPEPLALLGKKRVCVMEFAPGKTIKALLWSRATGDEIIETYELAGKILGQLHTAWIEGTRSFPVEMLARDLAEAPWHLSARQKKFLHLALESVAAATVRTGQLYYDYKPVNLLLHSGELYLVDPPEVPRNGVQLWDFVLFLSSVRRESWRFRLRRPYDRQRGTVTRALSAFTRGYLRSFPEAYPESILFAPTARLIELQSTAVLMTMERGMMDSTSRELLGDNYARQLRTKLTARMNFSFLEMEKAWLFRQLERDLEKSEKD